jgi:hypothetical protein
LFTTAIELVLGYKAGKQEIFVQYTNLQASEQAHDHGLVPWTEKKLKTCSSICGTWKTEIVEFVFVGLDSFGVVLDLQQQLNFL